MIHFSYSMEYNEHPMEFRRENFKEAMCNSQKEPPAPDGDKKTTSDSADFYDGSSKASDTFMDY